MCNRIGVICLMQLSKKLDYFQTLLYDILVIRIHFGKNLIRCILLFTVFIMGVQYDTKYWM